MSPEKETSTDGETKILVSIMQHLNGDIQFDADAVAAQLGYKDGTVVKRRWRQIKSKTMSASAAAGGGIKKRTPKGKGSDASPKKVTPSDDDEDDFLKTPKTPKTPKTAKSPKKTPTKRAGKPGAKSEAKATEEGSDDDIFGDLDDEGDA